MTSLSSLYITGIPTTSADIADQLADETGSGALVFSDSPTFTGSPLTPTPTLASQVANKSYVDAYTFRKVEIGAISSGITAELFTHYAVDTTAGAVTVNLPAGSPGARIAFSDPAGNFSVNSLTLVPNGSETIVGVAPLELNTDFASVLLYWHTSLGRWCFETAENFFAAPVPFTNPIFLNGVCQFVQTTKPTERSAGVALVAGDRWYKTDDQTEWSWNGTYWLGLSPIIRSGYGSRADNGGWQEQNDTTSSDSIIMSPRRGSNYMLFLESAEYLLKVTTADSLNYWDVKWRITAFSELVFVGSLFPGDPGFTVNSPTDTYNKQSLNVLFSHPIWQIVAVGPDARKTGSPSNIFMSYNMILREVFP